MRLLFEGSVYFSESWTQNKNYFNYGIITVKPRFRDTHLMRTPHYLRTVCFVPGERKPLDFLLI